MLLYNLEIEKAVLGSLILDNTLIKATAMKISESHFSLELHKSIYKSILKLYEAHKVVDIATLGEYDITYIVQLMNTVVTTQNIKHHVKLLSDLAVRKEMLQAADKIKAIATDDDITNIELVKSEAIQTLNSISIPTIKNKSKSMSEAVMESLRILEESFKKGNDAYLKWNMHWLQLKTGGMKPEYTILAARPSVGKTAFALQMALGIAKQGGRVLIFSLETMSNILINRMICNHGNIKKDLFDNPTTITEQDFININNVAGQIYNLPITLFDDVFTIEELVLKSEEIISSEGVDLIIIDYLQLLETHKKANNPNERVSYISRQIKKLQQQNNIHIMALSQFSREAEKQNYPTLHNLRDSGSLEQDATNVWFLHVENQEEYKPGTAIDTQLIIAKQKEGQRNIKKTLKFYGNSQRFYDN